MIGYGGRGGGGGFGGFPYRSSHQQGQDGRRGSSGNNNNNRDGGRGGRRGPARGRQPRRPNYNPYYAELQIPQDQRGIIVGKGGSALRWLNGVTNAKVIVPHYLQQHRRGRGRRDPQNSRSGNDENDNNDQSTVQQHFEETNPQHQQQHPEQQQQQQQQQHPVRVNSNDLPSLIHSFCEISSLLSQTNLNAPSIPCSVKMKSNGRNQRNAQHDPSAMDVKILGDLMIHTPLSHSLLSHSSTHAEDNCQESLVFRGTIILPSQTGCNNATPTPITTPVAAHVLETILEEEDIVTIVDNVRFVDASASESCQWYFREVPHRYWSLERNQQQQRQQQQYQHGDPVGNTINGERTSLQPNGDDNTSCNATDRDESTSTRRLVFVFGSNEDHLQRVCRAIVEATAKAWMKHCYDSSFYSTAIETELGQDDEKTDEESKQQNVRKSNDSNNEKTFPFSIGTYNLLHPTYALKYHQPMGLNALGGSNWKQWRAPAISAILEQSALDVYFLQEVDADQLKEDIMTSSSSSSSSTPSINRNKVLEGLHYLGNKQKINCLAEMYESIHFTHPTREARDGVAILVKTSRFDILESTMVPFSSKLPSTTEQNEHAGEEKHNVDETNNHYMCAATAVVRDKLTDVTFLLACVHLYDKKCVSPQKTLLEYIHTKVQSNAVGIDAVIWGGDCNRDYGLGKESIVFDGVEYRPVWYPGKMNNDVDDNTSLRKMDSCSGLHSSSLWDKDKKIDWIFYRVVSRNDGLRISSSIDEVCIDFMARTRKTLVSTHSPLSDHFAVAATISVSK